MKTKQIIRQINKLRIVVLSLLFVFTVQCTNSSNAQNTSPDPTPGKAKKIKLALLLDTSNSMDGLIDQAKSQLWTIVNELAKATCDNTKPDLEIALYEYGNDNLSAREGYIRLVTPLTTDLDKISADLFKLRTNGGSEFCGHAINTALSQLDWSPVSEDYQVIFIAGNEPFTQGSYSYIEACRKAVEKDVVVNTIFCGDFDEGVNTSWKDGAVRTKGSYMSIDQDRKTVYIETPYDKKIAELNNRLNDTYIAYGSLGRTKKQNQVAQDRNAMQYGQANLAKRAVSKSSHVYKNDSWDLVDASKEKSFSIAEIEEDALPTEMKNMDDEEKMAYIVSKNAEREKIQAEIVKTNLLREDYIAKERAKQTPDAAETLDNAMITAIKEQAKAKQFAF